MLTPSYSTVGQPILQPIAQPVIQTITQPVIQPIPQSVIQPVIQPVVPQTIPPSVTQLQQPYSPPAQPWKIKFPAIISGILSFFQLVLAIAIIGCEIGSILIDMITSTIYVGLWAGIFFVIAAISLAVSCESFVYFPFIDLFFRVFFKHVAFVLMAWQRIHLSFSVYAYSLQLV